MEGRALKGAGYVAQRLPKRKTEVRYYFSVGARLLVQEGAAAILNLVNTLKACGVRIISFKESWTEAPGEIGEVLYAIAGWVAKMESQRRSEKTKAGLARAVA